MKKFKIIKTLALFLAVITLSISAGGCSLINPIPRADGKLEIIFLSHYFSQDPNSTVAKDMLSEIDGIKSVRFDFFPVETRREIEMLTLFLAGKRGDILVVDKTLLKLLVDEMAAEPLDEFIEAGVIDMEGTDVNFVTMICNPGEEYADEFDKTRRIYGVTTGKMFGLMSDFFVDNRSAVMIIPSYSADKELAAQAVQWMKERYSYSALPEFAVEYDRAMRAYWLHNTTPDRSIFIK